MAPTGTTRPDPDATAPAAPPWRAMSASERRAFTVLNASTAPVWLLMILFPRARLTERVVALATPLTAALGVAYVGFLATSVARGAQDGGGVPRFDDPDVLRAGLASPVAFLAGWTHYLALDLYAGRVVREQALARGRVDRLPLLLTWWAGPAGVSLHLARNLRRRRP